MIFQNSVLAKRFTIICLIFALFGIGFANLVISRPAHAYKYQVAHGCAVKATPSCNILK